MLAVQCLLANACNTLFYYLLFIQMAIHTNCVNSPSRISIFVVLSDHLCIYMDIYIYIYIYMAFLLPPLKDVYIVSQK